MAQHKQPRAAAALDLTAAGLTPQALGRQNVDELFAFMQRCSAFFELVDGRAPTSEDAALLIEERPETLDLDRKLLLGLRQRGRLVGVLELLLGYPDDETWYLGLLVFDPALRGAGLGAAVYAAIRQWAVASGARAMRLVVQEQNPSARRFWQAMGFREIGRTTQQTDAHLNQVVRMAHAFD